MSYKCPNMLTVLAMTILLTITSATSPSIIYPTYLQLSTTSPLL
jgi:hypothetical protein